MSTRADIELAWAAGFFDGEGTICYRTHTRKNGSLHGGMEISVGQASSTGTPKELIRFQNAIGGAGKIYGPYAENSKISVMPMYRFKIGARSTILLVAELLWPYLCDRKKEKFREVFIKQFLYESGRRRMVKYAKH